MQRVDDPIIMGNCTILMSADGQTPEFIRTNDGEVFEINAESIEEFQKKPVGKGVLCTLICRTVENYFFTGFAKPCGKSEGLLNKFEVNV